MLIETFVALKPNKRCSIDTHTALKKNPIIEITNPGSLLPVFLIRPLHFPSLPLAPVYIYIYIYRSYSAWPGISYSGL